MANKTLQFLRNSVIFENRAAALTGIKAQLASAPDGSPVIARYNTTVGDKTVERTLFGIAGLAAGQYEIFDNQGDNDAINTAIQNLIGGASSGFDTLKEIEDVIKGLDLTAVGGGDGDVITTVSESDGQVSASKASLSGIKLTGYAKTNDTGDIAATDTVTQALSKLENKSAATTVKSTDKTVNITDNNGKDLSVNIDGTTIVSNDTNGVLSADLTLAKLTSAEVTALGDANVKEAYKVIYATDGNRTAIGDVVKIYKDQTLKSASFANQILTLTYILADGSESVVNIDMSSLIIETEVENGIQAIDHKLSIKLDTSGDDTGSGKFLTVGANGLKLDGVTDAITAAVAALDATESQTAGADGLALSITEVDGVITEISGSIAANTYDTYGAAAAVLGTDQDAASANTVYGAKAYADAKKADVIGESTDAASANTIYGAKAYADAAIAALDAPDTAVANQFVTSVSESDGVITVTRTQAAAAGVTVSDTGGYFAAENVEAALAELATFNCGTY